MESEEVQGWEVGKLGDFIEINKRSITKNYPYNEIEYVDISSVSVGHLEGTTLYS
jgi:type I restriction enzyme S subunit